MELDLENRNSLGRKAIVIFDTRFGSTEKIAKALESGLKAAGLATNCANLAVVPPSSLIEYDLLCVGAPTEAFSASKPMKEFLKKLKELDLKGRFGFAFDTKIEWRLSGSGAKYIEKELGNLGLSILRPRESALVVSLREGGNFSGSRLLEGEEKKFEQIGAQVGSALLGRSRVIPA